VTRRVDGMQTRLTWPAGVRIARPVQSARERDGPGRSASAGSGRSGANIRRQLRGLSARIPRRLVFKWMPLEGTEEKDATLVAAAVAGDGSAKQALFRRHAPMANRLARRLLGPGVDASDLVQDAFVEALLGIDRLKNGQAFQAWLCAIVVRTAQKMRRRRRLLERFGLLRQKPLEMDGFCSPSAPPDVAVELRAIYALLHTLPVEMHMALVLRRIEGMSIDEIAEHMQVSVSTVKRRLAAAEGQLESWTDAKEGQA
jgi:RNA polymerase sigma-70 factor, ECF subfamily